MRFFHHRFALLVLLGSTQSVTGLEKDVTRDKHLKTLATGSKLESETDDDECFADDDTVYTQASCLEADEIACNMYCVEYYWCSEQCNDGTSGTCYDGSGAVCAMDKLSHIEETCSGENWRSQPEDWSPTSVSIVSSATLDNISFSGCDNHAYCTFCKDNSWCEYVVETVAPSVLSDYDTIIAAGYGPLAMSLLAQLSDVCSAINSLSDDVVATIDGTSSKTHGPSARPSAPPSTSQMSPSSRPSTAPASSSPSIAPVSGPTLSPSIPPVSPPSIPPVSPPSIPPSIPPASPPSTPPVSLPSIAPVSLPSIAPVSLPSIAPSITPVSSPSIPPVSSPSIAPVSYPSITPVSLPSITPSIAPASPSVMPSAAPLSSSTHAPTTVLETQSGKSQDHSRSTSHWRRWLVIGGICGAVILMGFVHLFREKSGEKSADYKRISYDEPKPGKSNYYQHEAAWREKRKNERRTWREAGRPSSTYGLT